MSSYPPGVTGFEPQIAGPDSERELPGEERECFDECEWAGEVDVEEVRYGYTVTEYWTCPECGHEHETDVTDKYDEDPDPDGDRYREDW